VDLLVMEVANSEAAHSLAVQDSEENIVVKAELL
jgi:hypothetical protein